MYKKLENLFEIADSAVLDIEKKYYKEVKCKKGCTDCCYAVFDVSLIEALFIRQHFDSIDRKHRRIAINLAKKALKAWNQLITDKADPSLARIRCPLLNDTGECICYKARPINCRTYGVPTSIGNKGHVCGLSGFQQGITYPTINLEPFQRRLYDLSVALKGKDLGRKRWPIAAVLLNDIY
jgi:Fe-S-cluster containining protein